MTGMLRQVAATGTLMAVASVAQAATTSWITWNTPAPSATTATGTIIDPVTNATIYVKYTGEIYGASEFSGVRYSDSATVNSDLFSSSYSAFSGLTPAPPSGNFIALAQELTNKLEFFSDLAGTTPAPVTNLVLTLTSLGGYYTGYAFGSWTFDEAPQLLSQGLGAFSFAGNCNYGGGNSCSTLQVSGNNVNGVEGNGVLQFPGTITSLSWKVDNGEVWAGFAVGLNGSNNVPEPTSLSLLLGAGLALAAIRRRRHAAGTAGAAPDA